MKKLTESEQNAFDMMKFNFEINNRSFDNLLNRDAKGKYYYIVSTEIRRSGNMLVSDKLYDKLLKIIKDGHT